MRRLGPGVVQKLVDDGVELADVGGHVFARILVGHAHLGFQAQAGQRRAQVVRNAGQHDDPVLLDLGQLLGHAVKADVDLANFAGGYFLIEQAGVEISITHAAGRKRQLPERLVDQARDESRTGKRQGRGDSEPDHPGAVARWPHLGGVGEQPIGVSVNRKAHPQALLAIDHTGHNGVGPQPRLELLGDALAQFVAVEQLEGVLGFPRGNAHTFLIRQGLDQR